MENTENPAQTMDTDILAEFVKKTSRAENVVDIIIQGIVKGYWKPGDKINDLALSERLGVSRITVREALSKLVERNLVEKKHWKGYAVRRFTWAEIDGLIDVRLVLEELALRKVIEKMTPEVKADLANLLEESKKLVAAGDFKQFFTLDYEFHEYIYHKSGNAWISGLLGDLRLVINMVRIISQVDHSETVARNSIGEHERIVEDLMASRWESAVAHLKEHLNHHRERVRKEFAEKAFLAESDDAPKSGGEGDAESRK
ncbi:MAG: GntR family transcriptional regulator [Candidatus Shapirobacteria bacterium]|jgi:DNA-binding GntR family transcriptional regulator